jgi:hypothetical protein
MKETIRKIDVHERITLEQILWKSIGVCKLDLSGSGYGQIMHFCEDGSELSGVI